MVNTALQFLLFALVMLVLMVMVKLIMIATYRQNVHFSRKFLKSFFYYDIEKIGRAQELRLKRYYRNSNRVNNLFYAAVMFFSVAGIGIYVVNTVETMIR